MMLLWNSFRFLFINFSSLQGGVTEEQMLKFMGANTHLSVQQAKELIEDEKAGFAYLSLREARPSLYEI
jgi:hypothetical protein